LLQLIQQQNPVGYQTTRNISDMTETVDTSGERTAEVDVQFLEYMAERQRDMRTKVHNYRSRLQYEQLVLLQLKAPGRAEQKYGIDDAKTLVGNLRDGSEVSQAVIHGTHNALAYEKSPGPTSSETLDTQKRLAECYVENGRHAEAVRLLGKVLAMATDARALTVCQDRLNLVKEIYAAGTDRYFLRSVNLIAETLRMPEQILGTAHIKTIVIRRSLGADLFKLSKVEEAAKWFRLNIEALSQDDCGSSTSMSATARQAYLKDSVPSLGACEKHMTRERNLGLEDVGELVQCLLMLCYQNQVKDSVNENQISGPSTRSTGSSLTVPSMRMGTSKLAGEERRTAGERPPREELRRTRSSIRPEPAKLLDTGTMNRKPRRACSVDPPREEVPSKRSNSLASSPGRSNPTCSE
jgi:tetratricopeptide (TPR) repeat protein